MRLSHIGNNYPCLLDPSVGSVTNQNSSTIFFEDPNKKAGTYAEISLKQVKNYGTREKRTSTLPLEWLTSRIYSDKLEPLDCLQFLLSKCSLLELDRPRSATLLFIM